MRSLSACEGEFVRYNRDVDDAYKQHAQKAVDLIRGRRTAHVHKHHGGRAFGAGRHLL